MTQKSTFRSLFRMLPGHMFTPPQERETESLCSPFVLQQITLTFAGTSPFAAETTFNMTFPLNDGSGLSGTVGPVVIPAATTLTAGVALINAAMVANGQFSQLFLATQTAALVITLVAKSPNISINPALLVETFSPAVDYTMTPAQSVAAAAPSLEMGLFYVLSTATFPVGAITGTPRGARPAALPGAATTIADLRGVIARKTNSTTLSPTFIDGTTFDAYPAGRIWPGMLRGEVAVRVDPASPAITASLTQQIHVVIAAGVYSHIGSVAGVADGANTLRIDNAPTGNILARVIQTEETFQAFSGYSGRCVALKVNRTN